MADFRFNFGSDASASGAESPHRSPPFSPLKAKTISALELDAPKVPGSPKGSSPFKDEQIDLIFVQSRNGSSTYKVLRPSATDVADRLGIPSDHDVVPGVYEGGLKLWECSVDLVNYLGKQADVSFRDKRVVELGCGHSLPGIYALKEGAASVVLQDMNQEVLESITQPNVLLNVRSFAQQHARYVSGDWSSIKSVLAAEEGQTDFVLSSDTLYNSASYPKLYSLLSFLLKRTSGVAFFAAKRYYFGVGGGTSQFKEFVEAEGVFKVEIVQTFEDAQSNLREILKITLAASE